MRTVINLISARLLILFSHGILSLACAQSSLNDNDDNADVWKVLPERLAPPKSLSTRYQSIGFAVYRPELMKNGICITRKVEVGYPLSGTVDFELIAPSSLTKPAYYIAFTDDNVDESCSQIDFESKYVSISQPIDAKTLLQLRSVLSIVPMEDLVNDVVLGESLEGLKLSRVAASYSKEFRDLVYDLIVRNDDGLVLNVRVGIVDERLHVLAIHRLIE